jgi:signal transduction histidine kinase
MFVSAAWIGPALLALVSRVAQARIWGQPAPSVAQLLFESLDWLIYGFFAPLIFALSRRWPLSLRGTRSHWLIHGVAAVAFCAAWAGAGTVLKWLLGTDSFEQGIGVSFAAWFFITLPFGTGAYLGMVGIEHAIRHYTAARDWEARAARAAEQVVSARLAALQARLNPHFLFNSLNTVTVLVREGDTDRAASVLEQLSDVLRRTLATHDAPLVALGEELVLVRQYLAVEQARFSDRLRPEFDVPDELLAAAVPCFALQHLVENAVRHGISNRSDAGRITVSARRDGDMLALTVTDDGAGFDSSAPVAPGHGLENTRARLHALYGDRASLVVEPAAAGGAEATLRIPYTETTFDPGSLDDA